MQSLERVLAAEPFFAGLDAEHMALLAGCAGNVRFDAGATIFRRGDPADVFYVIRHGAVALETFVPGRGQVMIETLEAGEALGWSWLFEPYTWHFDARALGVVRATGFDGACLRGKCDEDPALGYDLMRRFAQVIVERLQSTRLRLLDVYGRHDG